ncbi:small, acid-soluble spore protein K [Pontibacillus salicampi]|uniref:Small, acid-soluble spore protein K n=1 Tax=Pontibacillus salicampi TaxID=1449801 RepID=A0ABV6LI14_9BACI
MARNKTVNFPEKKPNGEPQAKAEYASKRANGTINTRPQERMRHSSKRNDI